MSDYYAPVEKVHPLFRQSDPETSKEAGEAARDFLGEHERRIVEALAKGPGGMDDIARRQA